MRPRCRPVVLTGLVLAAFGATRAAAAEAPGAAPRPGPVIVGLALRGMHAFDPQDIVAKLATQVSTGPLPIPIAGLPLFAIQRWFGTPAVYRVDPDALALDRRRIEAFYRERGYYDAQVAEARLTEERPGQVSVIFDVAEGRPVRVARVEITGIEGAPAAQAKLHRLPLRVGEVFTEGSYDATKRALLAALRSTGYANGEVAQEARILPAEGTAEATFTVRPGARFRFGPIFVAGSGALPRDRVREQAAIEIRPGAWFDESKLASAQARVFELGVFGGVRVTRGTPDPARGIIPVVVAVREAPVHTLRAGPGVGVQANARWDLHAMAGYTDRNFFGDLRRLQLDVKVGYAFLLVTPRKEAPVGLANLEFSQPGAISRRIDAAARLELERGIEQAYDFWSERLRVGFPVRIAPRLTFVPSYNLEVYQLSNTSGIPTAPDQPSGQGPQLENCKANVCLLSFLEQRLGWDGRDDPVNTRRGLAVSIAVQEGFNVGGFGYRYLRFLPEARGFLPLGPRFVLAARVRAGALIPVSEKGDPPIIARFFAGGPQSMRGYYTRRLSPMVRQRGDFVPVGGNGLADGSLELRFDVTGNLGGAVFLDGGNVSVSSALPTAYQTALDPSRLQWAAGLGLRYRTPFGPLRVDVASRLPSDFRVNVPFALRFPTVPATDHREPIIAIHLSIGEAF